MKKLLFFLSTFMIIISMGCIGPDLPIQDSPQVDRIDLDSKWLMKPDTLVGEVVLKNIDFSPSRIAIANGNLFLECRKSREPYLVAKVNLLTDSISYMVPSGQGDKGINGVNRFRPQSESEILIYDHSSKQAQIYDYSDEVFQSRELEKINFEQPPYELFRLKDRSFVGLSYSSQPFNRYLFYDSFGFLIESKGNYPENTYDEIDTLGLPEAFKASMTVNETLRKIAIAYQFQDLVEITDFDFRNTIQIVGPNYFKPAFKSTILKNGGHDLTEIDDEFREGYFSIQSNNNEIWALYSGQFPFKKGELPIGKPGHVNQVFVFNWEGQLINHFILGIPVYGRMAVDFENKELYALTGMVSNGIVRFSYP